MITNEKLLGSNASRFSWKARLKSFAYAARGIVLFFKTEHNAQVHLTATVLVVLLSVTLGLTAKEAIAVVFSIAIVWISEMINTVIEKIMDFMSVQQHPQIKKIKDLAAGTVLISAIAAGIAGGIIFLPKILAL